MPVEEIINWILSSRKDLTRGTILQMIDRKIKETKGFLTPESAARAVAAELGLEIAGVSLMKGMPISDLVSGLGDVTVVGRVLHVSPLRTFIRSNSEEGKMRSLYIADKTSVLRVVLWGEKADLPGFSEMVGKIVRFSHGYVRRGYNGKMELNIGSRGKVEIAPLDVSEEEFPPVTRFFTEITQIRKSKSRVNTIGLIANVYPVTTFTREDGSTGKVRRLELKDESGRITVVLWNNKVDELINLENGKYLEIFGAKIREDMNGRLELHVDGPVDSILLDDLPLAFQRNPTSLRRKREKSR